MQGDVLAPLISSLQVDTMGKECLEKQKHLFYFRDSVPIGPLGMVDDLLTISECGVKTNLMNQYINFKTGTKRLQFGTSKCVKMHIGKPDNILCKDVHVGGWKVDVVTDPETGESSNREYFNGLEKMKVVQEQTYLGDLISSDGTHTKKVQQRSNKGLGVITQIMNILESTYFGKYFFEVALVLRESLFLSSLLLNTEAWVNYTDKDVRILEQCDEILLTKIMDCGTNSSNAMKYLELGVVPVRFEIMKRKLGFLQYILKQNKDSMIYKILKVTSESSVKNDFVYTCKKYMKTLNLEITFEEIEKMSKFSFKKLLKEKIQYAAFSYLEEQKTKQKKIKDIVYSKLEMQEYLVDGDRQTNVSKMIYKARGRTLDIKLHQKWKYSDTLCSGCQVNEESGEEILRCESFGENEQKISYSWFYSSLVSEQISAGKVMMKKLKAKDKIVEEIT